MKPIKNNKLNSILKFKYREYKYIKVYRFRNDKTVELNIYAKDTFKPDFLLDPDHVFNHAGFSTIIISDTKAETINPLDLKSKYNVKDFTTAINSKLIHETFSTLKSDKIDLVKVLLFFNIAINLVLLFILAKSQGVI
ncbi:MAG: hypothetical protein QXI16_05575 [Sulfolobaceae archaeon]